MGAVKSTIYALAVVGASAANADMIDTSELAPYEVCALCHSLDGVSRMAKFPKLAGQPSLYLQKQIKDFRAGHRTNDGGQMESIVRELAPEDIPVVADWFAAQPAPPPDEIGDDHATGAELYAAQNCATCHAGAVDQSPLHPYLEAQHSSYLVKQMTEFRDGARQNDPGQLMQKAMIGLSDGEIRAIATYLAATPRPTK